MICWIWIALAAPQESRELRTRFVRGEEFRLTESQTIRSKHENVLDGSERESLLQREVVQTWKVVEVEEDGSAEIAVESARVRVDLDGATIANVASWPEDAGKLLLTLGGPFDVVRLAYRWHGSDLADPVAFLGPGCQFRVTSRGGITHVRGLNALRVRYRESATKLTSTPGERMSLDVQMWHLLSEPHVKAALSLWFVPCLEQGVREGEEWTTSIRLQTEVARTEFRMTHQVRGGDRSLEIPTQATLELSTTSKAVTLRPARMELSLRRAVHPQTCWVQERSYEARTEMEIQVNLDSGPETIQRVRSEATGKGAIQKIRTVENLPEPIRARMEKRKWRSAFDALKPLLDAKDPPKEAREEEEECVNRGSLIVFLTEGGFEISVGRPDGEGKRVIVPKRDWAWGYHLPVWSPDGRVLAYTYHGDKGNEIRLVDRDGSDDRPLVPSRTAYSGLTWAPDGRTILFSGFTPREGGDRVWAVGADGKDLRTWSAEEGVGPDWSQDGKAIVARGASSQLQILDLQGNPVKKLGMGDRPRWSPDGRRIAFLSHTEGLGVMNADGTDRRLLVRTEEEPDYISWSPDGRNIAYSTMKRRIFTLSLETGERKEIYSGLAPHWSPVTDEE